MELRFLRVTPVRKTRLIVGAACLVIVGAAIGFLTLRALAGGEQQPNISTSETVKAVGRLYILPTDEQPTVAKITDRSQLDGQTFFDPARNGDILLVYKRSKLALLYRPEAGRLVNVGPVTFPNDDSLDAGTR